MGTTHIGKDLTLQCTIRNPENSLQLELNAIIDTGSNIDCISDVVAHKLSVKVSELRDPIYIQGINGVSATNKMCDLGLNLPDGSYERLQPWIVANHGNFDLIIGTGSLAAMKLSIITDDTGQFHLTRNEKLNRKLNCLRQSISAEPNGHSVKIFQEYSDVFRDRLIIPPSREADLRIRLKGDNVEPVALAPYRFPVTQLAELQTQLNELLTIGQIEHSQSPWAAPGCNLGRDGGV